MLFYKSIQIENDESRDEMSYDKPAQTEFQEFIRLSRSGNTLLNVYAFGI